ncbi:PBP1A family penicillin-binding protein [Microvirga sp. W0021]|uniref:peptidoglycan glycosyltransferase n=1 Tax=Hohaiivirga grylli TaxID=3133970 RepID=A0ABV0BFN2_9HYPH
MTANGRERREPVFGRPEPDHQHDESALNIGLSRQDRAGGEMARPVSRRSSTNDSKKPLKKTSKPRRAKKPRKRRSILGRMFYTLFVLGLWCLLGVAGVVAYYASQLPPIDQLTVPRRPPNIAILAADGSLITNRGETGGREVSIKELPSYVPKAFVAIEDRRFYSHFGIDPMGLGRAVISNVSGGLRQGASTLTQQLAKNLFLTPERTASRKIQEAILALWLERKYTKDQILELYLNRVYFGAGAFGVEAAARRYYNKPAKELTLSEAAVIAGLVQAPSRLAPNRNPKGAQGRATIVLKYMRELGFINQAQADAALANPAKLNRAGSNDSANYAADFVMDVLDDFIGEFDQDIIVQTSIDLRMQRAAAKAVTETLTAKGAQFNVSQAALVSITPEGALKALVGGKSYEESQYNRATTGRRQPGSAFKPFVYLTAMEYGMTPATVIEDGPVNYRGWSPQNYSRRYSGPVQLRDALAFSLNTIAAKLIIEVGPRNVIKTAQRLGINSPLEPVPSLALGVSDVSLMEMTSAYAAFANGGFGVIPYVIETVKSAANGKLLYQRPPTSGKLGRVMSPENQAEMIDMMHNSFAIGSSRNASVPGWDLAGKTGTTQAYKDAWMMGFSSTLVTGVWMGNDTGELTKRLTGSGLPAEIWKKYMTDALATQTPKPLIGAGWQPNGNTSPSFFGTGGGDVPPQGMPQQAPRQQRQDRNFFERLFGVD